ncbi:Muniscin C-terminal mu homology domain-containing protein [Apodospora peruviana]|uniref:Muniscin C-terminal mu homology domain-containing protein n=1 Tax=Apodospora peruviana TaxID=516989 RepID=A0AAE0I5R4_9PEZI|nr:Muniscin C-terminal mu homology domain-containing protein [Apodospora peruviana]
MDDLSRPEYPAMLANLHPSQAVQALSDRVKRISKVNQEIADWLQERRRVEEQYVASLRKLLVFKVPNTASELGVFQGPWDKILQSTDAIATSHQIFAQRVEKDVEQALRSFQNKKEMQNIHTISANLHTMSKELEDATEKSDKLSKKGGKANAQKVDQASSRLEAATQQWESQAPFIFETLQALDEQRINHLRDVLTQFGTHEVDQSSRTQKAAEEVLNTMLEVNTAQEIQNFAQRTTAGKPKLERKSTTRQNSVVGGTPSLAPPSISGHDDDVSDHSGHKEGQPESRLRSRIGTMLGRRRQSIHGGFGPLAPPKGLGSFSRNLGSSHGQTLSPRASSHNLTDSQNRLSSLAESPTTERPGTGVGNTEGKSSHEGTNGVGGHKESGPGQASSILNGTAEAIFDAPPPPGPPPSHQNKEEPSKDAEGFTIPTSTHDPISEAQKEAAADEADQFFKLSIQKEPIVEEDQDAKKAALSNVANTLTQMGMPSRKSGTIRGRRDVRNTIYMPTLPVPENSSENPFPPSPALPTTTPVALRPTPASTFASEMSHASDTQSIRSGTSFGGASSYSVGARLKHPDMHGPEYGPGLHSSIIETVSATFQDGVVKSAKVTGEIALAYTPDPNSSQPERETIRLDNFPRLDSIGPNRVFVANTATGPDEFTVDVSHLSVTSPAFTYRVHAEDETTLASQCPILVHPVWKPQGDKLGLLLQYRLNPSSALPQPVTLSNVVFVATYEGARASGVQTKPSGTHLKDKHLVYWRLGDVMLTDSWAKIICRVIGEQNAEPQPGHIEVRWDYGSTAAGAGSGGDVGCGISVSRLVEGKGKEKAEEDDGEDDPFADDKGPLSPAIKDTRTWAEIPLVRRLVSGKYEAK